MSAVAGLPAEVGDINRTAGQAVVALAQALDTVSGLQVMFSDTGRGYGVANLTTAMGSPAATLLLNSFTDLANLFAVAHGQQAQPGASDFFFNAKQLMGTTPL